MRQKRALESLIFLVLVVFFVSTPLCYSTTILIYHKIGDNRTPSTNVSISLFKRQMAFLKKHGYRVISLKELVKCLENHEDPPEKSVVLTFDDGYRSVYEHAFGVIKSYHYPATVFLPTEAIEKHYPDYLTMQQISSMRKYGIDFESHGYAHHHMAFIPKGFSMAEYKRWIEEDIKKSIEFFKKRLGYTPVFFAIPYGEYNRILIDTAKEMGFKAILTQDPGSVNKFTPLYLLPREPILGKVWSTMKHFKMVLNREYLPVGKRIPPIGFLNTSKPGIIGARLLFPDRYGSCGVYVSEFGWRRAETEGNLVYIRNSKSIARKKNRIAVTCRDRVTGKSAVNFWMVIKKR